jgi:hypothetical protein
MLKKLLVVSHRNIGIVDKYNRLCIMFDPVATPLGGWLLRSFFLDAHLCARCFCTSLCKSEHSPDADQRGGGARGTRTSNGFLYPLVFFFKNVHHTCYIKQERSGTRLKPTQETKDAILL